MAKLAFANEVKGLMAINMPVDESETEILSAFFRYLEDSQKEYCVVGRAESLPQRIIGDVDFVVSENALIDMDELIFDFCQSKRLSVVQVFQHEQTAYYYVLAWIDGKGEPMFLCLDICADYYRNGRRFLTADEILCERTVFFYGAEKTERFFLAAPARNFIYYLLKKIDKQQLSEAEGAYLTSNWEKAPAECNKEMERFWPNDYAEFLKRALNERKWMEVREKLPILKRALHSKLPHRSLQSDIQEALRVLSRILNPTGLHVAFLGPDGSGKTSVIRAVVKGVAPAFRKTAQFHLRPGIGRNGGGRTVDDPHAVSARSWAGSLVKAVYLLFDYCAGWWIKIWPKKIRSTLVIYDRYYHDILVDTVRYRYSGPECITRLIGNLIPKPDLWILLDAPPEILQARKSEVSFEESARQRDAYLQLVARMSDGIVIDAARPLEKVVVDVELAILDYLATPARKRLG